jgi:hypothetical protein
MTQSSGDDEMHRRFFDYLCSDMIIDGYVVAMAKVDLYEFWRMAHGWFASVRAVLKLGSVQLWNYDFT